MVLGSSQAPIVHRANLHLPPYSLDKAHPDCAECIMDCRDASCSGMTQQCTDQCVIVACDDPNHSSLPCVQDHCDSICDADIDCALHDADPCHDYHGDPKALSLPMSHSAHSQSWDEAFEAFLCSCGDTLPLGELSPSSGGSSSTHQHTYSSPNLSSSPQPSIFGSSMSTPSHPSMQFDYQHQHQHQQPAEATPPLACMWNNCHETFASLSELVGHVNLQHLRFPTSTPPTQNASPVSMSMSMTPSIMSGADLSCQWNNCNDYPTAQAIPGSSTSTSLDAALGVLANHLLQDHLGLQQPPTHMASSTPPSFASTEDHISDQRSASPRDTSSSVSSPSEKQHGSEGSCTCRWHGCDKVFTTVDGLTAHINTDHVGGGKAQYECLWEGCTRNGEKGFASKQKICRHIQSHTGHRPFQCKVCKQYFSEAATLQQHMRRHTQEKPYICDFPGCGKAFAIAGALTIHKRTHNGDKPFKCTYCDRAFSESSNLSKHLRTHTGLRPYNCTEPNCGKTFSRPDQLARHMGVHRKKAAMVALNVGPAPVAGMILGK